MDRRSSLDTPLVGRRAEVAAVVRALAQRPGVAVVAGEPGIGKSRLVAEVVAHPALRDARPLVGACHRMSEPFPFGAVVEAVSQAAPWLTEPLCLASGVLRGLVPELADHLPPWVGSTDDRHLVFRAFADVLAACGRVVLIIEDAQWADDGTREFLRYLTGKRRNRLSLLVTCDDNPGALGVKGPYEYVRVAPLGVGEVREMACAALGGQTVSPAFAEELHRRSAGVPFAVEVFLAALRDRADVVDTSTEGGERLSVLPLPPILRDDPADQLVRVPSRARRVLHAAAVLDAPASASRLVELAGIPPTGGAVEVQRAVDTGLLVADGGQYAFRHVLAREAVYELVPAVERQHLHGRVADVLERDAPVRLAEIAEHFRRSGRRADWLRTGEAAADHAIESTDGRLAAGLLLALLREPDLPEGTVDRLAVRLASVAQWNSHPRESSDVVSRLLADPRLSPEARRHVHLLYAMLLARRGDAIHLARQELELAVAALGDRPELAARAASVLAYPLDTQVPVAESVRWGRVVDGYLASVADTLTRHRLLANTLPAKILLGDRAALAVAHGLRADAPTMRDRREVARLYFNVADACNNIGHFRDAYSFVRHGLRWAEGNDAGFDRANARAITLRTDWFAGKWSGLVGTAVELAVDSAERSVVATESWLVAGWASAVAGDRERAVEHLMASGLGSVEQAVAPVALSGYACLIGIDRDAGDLRSACDRADEAMDLLRRKGVWAWCGEVLPPVVGAYLAAGRVDDAALAVRDAELALPELAAPAAKAAALLCRGRLDAGHGRQGRAESAIGRARARYRDLGWPHYAAVAAEWHADVLAVQSPARASIVLSSAIDRFNALGAAADATRCSGSLAVLRSPRQPRAARALSDQELVVARLLAAGHSNRAIAGRLFLSHRTVELHAASVLRKLDLPSRRDVTGVFAALTR